MKKLLITFGCSWTYGVGVGYQSGMTFEEYEKVAGDSDLADSLSFRGLLATKTNYENKNFSYGGSSNQSQFRLATEYFGSLEFEADKLEYNHIVVLWGITSLYRNEIYLNSIGSLKNIFYGNKNVEKKFLEEYFKKTFDEHNELRQLSLNILFWNSFFKAHNIQNYWFDTFNHHDYDIPVQQHDLNMYKQSYTACAGPDWPSWEDFWQGNVNDVAQNILDEINDHTRFDWAKDKRYFAGFNNFLLFNNDPRDLASYLALHNGSSVADKGTHKSNWRADVDRIDYLEKIKLVNPISFHPTVDAHEQIAELFYDLIDFV